VTHLGEKKRRYKVKGLTEMGANKMMFMNEAEGREMSVAEYFESKHQKK
jgi:eukaryotic translation initiation factor 2C